jgi:hypothetical protein
VAHVLVLVHHRVVAAHGKVLVVLPALQFRALGSQSCPMARALTSALLGRCLEPNTMSFEELLVYYTPTRIVID